jgi:hypothetical protein
VGIPLFGRVLRRAFGPSRSRVHDDGGLQYVFGKEFGSLGFSHRGDYIGGSTMLGGGPGGHTPWWHGLGLAHATDDPQV